MKTHSCLQTANRIINIKMTRLGNRQLLGPRPHAVGTTSLSYILSNVF